MKNYLLTLILCGFLYGFAQEKTVHGTITESNGLPLPGASILLKGTSQGTQTDLEGNYSIKAAVGQSLVVSFVGLKSMQITVGSSNVYNIKLTEEVKLEEVSILPITPKPRVKAPVTVIPLDSISKKKNAYLYIVNGKAIRYRKFRKIKPENIESIYVANPGTADKYKHKKEVTVAVVNLKGS
ncbi:MAG: carboxypeptidase-like regulatory domain-containing protein [Flavobacterium sp.]